MDYVFYYPAVKQALQMQQLLMSLTWRMQIEQMSGHDVMMTGLGKLQTCDKDYPELLLCKCEYLPISTSEVNRKLHFQTL